MFEESCVKHRDVHLIFTSPICVWLFFFSRRDIVVASARKYHAFFLRYRSDKEVVFSMPNQPAAAAAAPAAAAASAEGVVAVAPVEGSTADPTVAHSDGDAATGESNGDDGNAPASARSAKSTARSAVSAVSTSAPVEVEPPAPFALRFMLQKAKINFETSLPDLEAAVARMFDELGAFTLKTHFAIC